MSLNDALLLCSAFTKMPVASLGGGRHPSSSLQSRWTDALGCWTVRYSAKNIYAKYLKLSSETAMNTRETQYNYVGNMQMEGELTLLTGHLSRSLTRWHKWVCLGQKKKKITLEEKSAY